MDLKVLFLLVLSSFNNKQTVLKFEIDLVLVRCTKCLHVLGRGVFPSVLSKTGVDFALCFLSLSLTDAESMCMSKIKSHLPCW